MPLQNQTNKISNLISSGTPNGGSTIFYTTSFLAIYIFGSQPNDTGHYTFSIKLKNGLAEIGGFLVDYSRANATIPGTYTAYGRGAVYNDGNPNTDVFFQKPLTPPAGSTLLYLFFGDCFEQGNEEGAESSPFTAPSGTPTISPETPLGLTSLPYLAADALVSKSGVTYGGYSSSVCSSFGGTNHSFALIIPER